MDDFADLVHRIVRRKLTQLNSDQSKNRSHTILLKDVPSTFRQEIACMMYTYGDVQSPLTQSVSLVEKILGGQMDTLLTRAKRNIEKKTPQKTPGRQSKSSVSRNKSIQHEHILQILCNNKEKLRRMIQYMSFKDLNMALQKKNYKLLAEIRNDPIKGRRYRSCIEFLRKTEYTDFDFVTDLSTKDETTMKRLKVKYVKTLNMSKEEYEEFAQRSKVSFIPQDEHLLFQEWLTSLSDSLTDTQKFTIEILAYLAKETIAEIMDNVIEYKKRTMAESQPEPNIIDHIVELNSDDFLPEGPIFPDDIVKALETSLPKYYRTVPGSSKEASNSGLFCA